MFSSETLFLLGVTAGLGIVSGLFYLIVRGWIPDRRRVALMMVFFGFVGGAGLVRPDGIDFRELSPLPLAVAMFVAIPVALREVSSLRYGHYGRLLTGDETTAKPRGESSFRR